VSTDFYAVEFFFSMEFIFNNLHDINKLAFVIISAANPAGRPADPVLSVD